ncbi:MAG: 30S ribosomal protein S20, partial [Phycisphaerae bacterium]
MANLFSAKKRIKQNERNRLRNRARKAVIKTETRKLLDAIHDGKIEDAQELYRGLSKRLDQTAAKGTLHRRTAARRK